VTDAERIDALERRVRELEARPAQVPVYIPVYVPMPQPLYPRWWEVTYS
jgi:hypothetical protein